jgi:tetratricopeptide (TPR) repeat protein
MGGKQTFTRYERPMGYDFNKLEGTAASLFGEGRYRDALRIYLWMSDGDPSLDGGYLGGRIGECYERLGELDAARYWYARAVEENPNVRLDEAAARARLGDISIEDLCGPER